MLRLENSDTKPIIFCNGQHGSNYNGFKGDFNPELLKIEIRFNNIFKLFCSILRSWQDSFKPNFWSIKKEKFQYIGLSLRKFTNYIKKQDGLTFVYPILTNDYYIIFTGKSNKFQTYKLFAYLSNRRYSYVEILGLFRESLNQYNPKTEVKIVKKIKLKEISRYDIEAHPKLVSSTGFYDDKVQMDYFYFIKKPKAMVKYPFNKLSHLIVWNNDESIKFSNNPNHLLMLKDQVNLDEALLINIQTLVKRKE